MDGAGVYGLTVSWMRAGPGYRRPRQPVQGETEPFSVGGEPVLVEDLPGGCVPGELQRGDLPTQADQPGGSGIGLYAR